MRKGDRNRLGIGYIIDTLAESKYILSDLRSLQKEYETEKDLTDGLRSIFFNGCFMPYIMTLGLIGLAVIFYLWLSGYPEPFHLTLSGWVE